MNYDGKGRLGNNWLTVGEVVYLVSRSIRRFATILDTVAMKIHFPRHHNIYDTKLEVKENG